MQNPQQEIKSVIRALTTSDSPERQMDAVKRYFAEDAVFRSPFFSITPGPLSREDVLGVYQWYRIMSPKNVVNVTNVVWNQQSNLLFLETTQFFHIRFSPFSARQSKFIMRFKLKKQEKNYVITSQEDYYHPDDLMSLILPPLAPLVRIALSATSYASTVAAKAAQVIGFWRVDNANQANVANQSNGNVWNGTSHEQPGGDNERLGQNSDDGRANDQENNRTLDNHSEGQQWQTALNGKQRAKRTAGVS